ncbi:hypothetical protein CR513_39066, partial [Mucuna pruriens]
MPPQGNSPYLEDLMKQLAISNMEFQQNMNSISGKHERHHLRSQDTNRTISKHYEHNHFEKWRPETDEELLRMSQKVEINIPLLDAIK